MCCYGSLDQFIPVLLAFVVLSLVSSVLSQEIGWEECLRNDLFCVECDVKPSIINIGLCACCYLFIEV